MNDINFIGEVFPAESIELMPSALGIRPGERVLDVGGGGRPLPVADVIVEYDLSSGHDRDSASAPVDRRWIVADAEQLPFPDKSFDFVFCSHVLEHIQDPASACEELMRVAQRGYIETPRKLAELMFGHPTHRWLIDEIDGVLVFERRWFIDHPMHNLALAHVQRNSDGFQQALVSYRNLSCIQFAWQGHFKYRVISTPGWRELFDYENPTHAALSHYFFSRNMLSNDAPLSSVALHSAQAKRISPLDSCIRSFDDCVLQLLCSQLPDEIISPIDVFSTLATELTSGEKYWLLETQVASTYSRHVAVAERCGFKLIDCIDRNQLRLTCWSRTPKRRWRVSTSSPDDRPAMQQLFIDCFGHAIAPELWLWKYGNGRGQNLCVFEGERIVAHFGGVTRVCLHKGQKINICQPCDVMVAPSVRGTLTAKGPFFLVSTSFLELHVGNKAFHEGIYGFPSRRHALLGQRLGLYDLVDEMFEVSWEAGGRDWIYSSRVEALNEAPIEQLRRSVESSWKLMATALGHQATLVSRDFDYVKYRYLEHPTTSYLIASIKRRWHRHRVIVVLKNVSEGLWELMDFIGTPDDVPWAIPALRCYIASKGGHRITFWITHAHLDKFLVTGGTCRQLDIPIISSRWGDFAIPSPELVGRWWLTSGDSDWR